MPTLIVECDGKRGKLLLTGRTSVGRDPRNGVVIDHPTVSRLHAFIDFNETGAWLDDAGSRNGTRVDGARVAPRATLRDGSEIRIGVALARFFFDSAPALGPGTPAETGSVVVHCRCGEAQWVPVREDGITARCRSCGARLPRQHPQPIPAEPVATVAPTYPEAQREAPAFKQSVCGVCQWSFEPDSAMVECPECGLAYHADCWEENRGCASYGCRQVGALDRDGGADSEGVAGDRGGDAEALESAEGLVSDPAIEQSSRVAWVPISAAAVLGGGILGVAAFGVPALLASGLAAARGVGEAGWRRWVLLILAAAGLLLGLIGLAISLKWWLNIDLLEITKENMPK
jgi:hypothetical protein